MTRAEEAAVRTLHGDGASLISVPGVARYRLPVYVACTAWALLINYAIGKEMAWDTLNYHLYAGFSAVNDRFSQDYFPAGPQSYLNPYPYVPFYALVSSGLSALQSASLLAIVHSLILWLTFELALVAYPSGTVARRVSFALLAVALARVSWISPRPSWYSPVGCCLPGRSAHQVPLRSSLRRCCWVPLRH
jgi:hypothetical protein